MVPDKGIKQMYHLFVFGYYLYFDLFVATDLVSKVSQNENLKDVYQVMAPQFATIWAQFVIQDYFVLSCLEDLLVLTPKHVLSSFKHKLSDHANNILIYFALPFNMVMCANFWVLFCIDPRLVDEHHALFDYLDRSTNHVVHTYVMAIILIEMCFTHIRYPPSVAAVYPYRKMTITFACYWSVVFGMKLFSPIWPYPFLTMMTPIQHVAYLLCNLLLIYVCYAFGYFLNSVVWGENAEDSQQAVVNQDGWRLTSGWSQLSRVVRLIHGR